MGCFFYIDLMYSANLFAANMRNLVQIRDSANYHTYILRNLVQMYRFRELSPLYSAESRST